ncbi:MAG: cysteine desulfurase family protein [Vicinamibacterales bacterium]
MRVYFDYNATTPPAPEVVDAVGAVTRDVFGNASSVHYFGQQAKAAIDQARSATAELIKAEPSEIVFTAGGTESDNFALRGAADAIETAGPRRHLVASAIEHEAILKRSRHWPPWVDGHADSGRRDRRRVSRPGPRGDSSRHSDSVLMLANNEIGTLQPVADIARLAHESERSCTPTPCRPPARLPLTCARCASTCSPSRRTSSTDREGRRALHPPRHAHAAHLTGGKHERNRRAGTENTPAIAGMGVAARLAASKIDSETVRLSALRDRLEAGILAAVSGTAVNGAGSPRVANTTNISFDRIEAESLLIALDLEGIAVSTGSACSSGTLEPSHVLKAMGLPVHRTQNSLRFSLGAYSTDAEVDRVIETLPRLVQKLRGLSSRAGATAGR